MKTEIVVIHHSADYDGLFCREIARKWFGENAAYVGWDYGDPVPSIPESVKELYLLDISIESLMDDPRLIWIDHHKSAMEKYGKKNGLQIDGVAACRLAYQFLFQPSSGVILTKGDYVNRWVIEPLAVRLAGEYDVWDKRDPRAEVFQYGLKSCNLDNRWQTLVDDGDCQVIKPDEEVAAILRFGEIAKNYADNLNAEIVCAYGFDLDFEGLAFLGLNTARCNSLSFQAAIRPHHDGLLGFRFDGAKWTVSLYAVPHKPNVDLSKIAVKYGGGGHRQACGFQAERLPFIEHGRDMTKKPKR